VFTLRKGQFDPQFQVEKVVPHQPFFLSENWDKCPFKWYNHVGASFFRFVTIHVFDRQTDRRIDKRTDRKASLAIPCVALHAVAR